MSMKCYIVFIQEVSYRHDIAYSQVSDGGYDLQIWWVTENVLNNQVRAADKGWSSRL
jgi:hypothetical protein